MQTAYQPTTQFSAFPPVVKNLLIVNGLLALWMLVQPVDALLTHWFGLWRVGNPVGLLLPNGTQTNTFWPWQIVTYGFLHGGPVHLLFNMLSLWMFGAAIENVWGSKRFGVYYAICLVGAGVAQLVVYAIQGTPVPTVGASGAVLGILLAFGMMYPDQMIYVYLFPVKAKYLVLFYAAMDLFGGFSGSSSNVAHFAHLGGMLVGFVVILYWRGRLPLKPRERLSW